MQQLEDYPQTKEGAIAFVQDIFMDLGGTIDPPMRPRHRYGGTTPATNEFMMDFENSCLADWHSGFHPLGPKRHLDHDWAAFIQSRVFPFSSEIDWLEYCNWVENGYGDEWFQEDEEERRLQFLLDREAEEFEAGYLEAQTRLRTSYACREMVRPVSTPLQDRIVSMASIVNGGG